MDWAVKFASPFLSRFVQHWTGAEIEFKCPSGIPVLAMSDGMILRAGWDNPQDPDSGMRLRIRELVSLPGYDSWMLVYGNLGQLKTYLGQQVRRGQTIALTGGKPLRVYLLNRKNQRQPIPIDSE